MHLPSIKKLDLGYRFEQEREILALIYISYFYILLFSLVVVLLHTSSEELLPVSYRYHSLILLGIVEILLIRFRFFTLAKLLILTLTPFLLLILPPLTGFPNQSAHLRRSYWF